jgi:hypothetical protein
VESKSIEKEIRKEKIKNFLKIMNEGNDHL